MASGRVLREPIIEGNEARGWMRTTVFREGRRRCPNDARPRSPAAASRPLPAPTTPIRRLGDGFDPLEGSRLASRGTGFPGGGVSVFECLFSKGELEMSG
jgi:hypothetical protein